MKQPRRRGGWSLTETVLLILFVGVVLLAVTRLFGHAGQVYGRTLMHYNCTQSLEKLITRLRHDCSHATAIQLDGDVLELGIGEQDVRYTLEDRHVERQTLAKGKLLGKDRFQLPFRSRWKLLNQAPDDKRSSGILEIHLIHAETVDANKMWLRIVSQVGTQSEVASISPESPKPKEVP